MKDLLPTHTTSSQPGFGIAGVFFGDMIECVYLVFTAGGRYAYRLFGCVLSWALLSPIGVSLKNRGVWQDANPFLSMEGWVVASVVLVRYLIT